MISSKDFYNVMSAVVPLYVAMILAYGSVRWWKLLTPDQCSGINRFVALFAVPLLSFKIISKNNPYEMNVKFIAADTAQKAVVLIALALWARYSRRASLDWVITNFMVATLPNTLIMGIPLLDAMYGKKHGGIVVQAVVLQCIVWYSLLIFLYEYRSAKILIMEQFPDTAASIVSFKVDSDVISLDGRGEPVLTEAEVGEDGRIHVKVRKSVSGSSARLSSASSYHLGNGGAQHQHFLHQQHLHQLGIRSSPMASMFSSKAGTPRPSNLTGAEIYSLHSSRNMTPRDSSFNRSDLYLMTNGNRGSPQIHHVPSSSSEQILSTTEHQHPNIPLHQNISVHPQETQPSKNAHSPSPTLQLPKKGAHHNNNNANKDFDAKELHMFVWSSSASPTSERGVHVFGSNDFGDARHPESKETKLVVADDTPTEDPKRREGNFSFADRSNKDDVLLEPSLKLGSSSTAQLTTTKNTDDGEIENPNPAMPPASVMTRLILDMVWRKLVRNPNTYSSLIGLIWALVSFRWHVGAPKIVEHSISILSDAGLGMAMFSLGLFMALQKRILACGTSLALFGMVLRFFCGPAIMSVTSIATGLRSVDLRASIVQAALPQGIVPFVFAKEYNVHPDVLSTAVIFGMLVALPITLIYYVLLGI